MNFALDDDYLYGFTTLGNKIEWMRSNTSVCFEVEELKNHNNWTSIIVFGRYEELPDKPAYESARQRAFAALQKRVMWWEPAWISLKGSSQEHSYTPVFFRIHIAKITGRRANSDETEAVSRSSAARD
jgi:nitroimidazol reductase NimA-like FMN-containing flavoprotein (pyridoxamine 5'-phosphate oxidase superfamily)